MSCKSFQEGDVRKSILRKVSPKKIKKNGKHWKGYVYLENKLVTKVKIPNDHNRPFNSTKGSYVARDLKISEEKYNELVACTLTGPSYYELLKENLRRG